jgi:hypothetical protein
MYTEICAELGATIAVASTVPYIQFSLICGSFFRSWATAFFQRGQDYYSVSISRGKVTGVFDLNAAGQTDPFRRGALCGLSFRGRKTRRYRLSCLRYFRLPICESFIPNTAIL